MSAAVKWAVPYATAFMYGNGAQVLKDGKVVINSFPAWGGKLESEGMPLLQKAIVGQISPKECQDRWAAVLTKNMV